MYKKFVSVLYVINIIMQAIVTLLIPILIMFGISWLFIKYAGAPLWLYAILMPIGAISGFISMIKFIIRASEGLERLEKQKNKDKE